MQACARPDNRVCVDPPLLEPTSAAIGPGCTFVKRCCVLAKVGNDARLGRKTPDMFHAHLFDDSHQIL